MYPTRYRPVCLVYAAPPPGIPLATGAVPHSQISQLQPGSQPKQVRFAQPQKKKHVKEKYKSKVSLPSSGDIDPSQALLKSDDSGTSDTFPKMLPKHDASKEHKIDHEDTVNCASNNGVKDHCSGDHSTSNDNVPDGVDELDEQQGINREYSNLEKFQQQQKLIEAQNLKRRQMLQKAIAERKKRTTAEQAKLLQIQKELTHLDTLLNVDVSILRNKIEDSSREYSEAQKRYDRAEKEFIEAKIQLHKKTENKEQLTEHLYAIIQQNEMRKATKLAELMDKLDMELNMPELSAELSTTVVVNPLPPPTTSPTLPTSPIALQHPNSPKNTEKQISGSNHADPTTEKKVNSLKADRSNTKSLAVTKAKHSPSSKRKIPAPASLTSDLALCDDVKQKKVTFSDIVEQNNSSTDKPKVSLEDIEPSMSDPALIVEKHQPTVIKTDVISAENGISADGIIGNELHSSLAREIEENCEKSESEELDTKTTPANDSKSESQSSVGDKNNPAEINGDKEDEANFGNTSKTEDSGISCVDCGESEKTKAKSNNICKDNTSSAFDPNNDSKHEDVSKRDFESTSEKNNNTEKNADKQTKKKPYLDAFQNVPVQ